VSDDYVYFQAAAAHTSAAGERVVRVSTQRLAVFAYVPFMAYRDLNVPIYGTYFDRKITGYEGVIQNPGVGLTATNLVPRTVEIFGTGDQIRRS